MNCQICNKESGEYSLCPECFALMQNGEVKQCVNCKGWYKVGKVCECLKQSGYSKNMSTQKELPLIKQSNSTDQKEAALSTDSEPSIKPFLIIAITSILVAILIFGILLTNIYIKNTGPYGEETSWFTALTKEKPSIYAYPSYDPNGDLSEFLGYNFGINCKDDYKEVIVAVYYIDKNDNLIKTDYITFKDCKKGQKPEKFYAFTTYDILTVEDVNYELYKYS